MVFRIEKNEEKGVEVSGKNELILGSVGMIKVEEERDRSLKGGGFEIGRKGGKMIKCVRTGKDGEGIVKGVKGGEYRVRERKGGNGYVGLKKGVGFRIEMGEVEMKRLIVKNGGMKNEVDERNGGG